MQERLTSVSKNVAIGAPITNFMPSKYESILTSVILVLLQDFCTSKRFLLHQ
jgi:hypothetical protein